ncbi:polyphosphate kinase [Flavobacterium akiainvivens]|uniref:Polyphosphate kinase n=1 Tax=Flavobacterium akiainvivens TaxID=1202724 RepID=A0A0M8MDL5_9FLAO|nr:polyphosphate kinase 1 [Flavobacterium akiainvivens]KOS07995.1 polyphosphate kinase [Flavobacterium akiainvivens]SFQ61722.1 polyphosphate kinase [Flavobacterium akiainvivens]
MDTITQANPETKYHDRDLSWLTFNRRVLQEAADAHVPLLERIRFLSIWSSNLDEFYRVRIPSLTLLKKVHKKEGDARAAENLAAVVAAVKEQQEFFGTLLREQIIPELDAIAVTLVYRQALPEEILEEASAYFYNVVLAYLKHVELVPDCAFFPENNKLYLLANAPTGPYIINIPDELPRFVTFTVQGRQYVVFTDDIVKTFLGFIFPGITADDAYAFKITRDAELELQDEYNGDLARLMEKKLAKRDFGLASRLLYDAHLPQKLLDKLIDAFNLKDALIVEGGSYHNLKDLSQISLKQPGIEYAPWPAKARPVAPEGILEEVLHNDVLINTPYQSYNTVLRFFNEAATRPDVAEIFITLYRVASDSRIANALISAAANGKKVTVVVELKARFDEANNLKWTKRFKQAGIKILYSVPSLKVHAKIALVTFAKNSYKKPLGLLATGNLNESTARFYTDHILLTAHSGITKELGRVFRFLKKKRQPTEADTITFNHLLVAKFNLKARFIELIDREIALAQSGAEAAITIKLNNLEELSLIDKLYEASQAGVKVQLIVRGICCLVPGVAGLSENITVTRIVGRYLEHGRIFIFNNGGHPEVYMGSADWMNRNIYRRIEVCFPVYEPHIKNELLQLIRLQLDKTSIKHSQQEIYEYL